MDKWRLLLSIFGNAYSQEYIERGYTPPDEILTEILDTLTPQEKFVINHRFGDPPMTSRAIAKICPRGDHSGIGVTTVRVRQIKSEALRKLRHPSRSRRLWPGLHIYGGPTSMVEGGDMTTQTNQFKVCSRCKERKPVAQFDRNRTKQDGLQAYCRECNTFVSHKRRHPTPAIPQVDTPQVLDVSRIDELLRGVDENTALAKSAEVKIRELNLKLVEYAGRIVELQNQIAAGCLRSH